MANININIYMTFIKHLRIVLSAFAILLAVGTFGIEQASASTYMVDLTGRGCGNNCADFQNFLTANGISTTVATSSTSNSSSCTNGVCTTTSPNNTNTNTGSQNNNAGYQTYPNQVYVPFTSSNGTNSGGYNTAVGTTTYVQYPYYSYQYFQNPASKYDSYLSGQYPESVYVYYGKDAASQMNKYKKTYTSTSSSNSSGTGFTITSILK